MSYRTFKKDYIPTRLILNLHIGHILEISDFSDEELELFHKKIGSIVKKYREERNTTQMQLALAINHTSVGHVAKAELYKYGKHFSLEQLYKISKVLNIKMSVFFEDIE